MWAYRFLYYTPTRSRGRRSAQGVPKTVATNIEVEKIGEGKFQVRVIEGKSQTTHGVTLKKADYERIAGGKVEPEELVRRSFEFLLENEPKESVLARFDLLLIGRYFPNYEREMTRRLAEKR
jgi:hypothetical protein